MSQVTAEGKERAGTTQPLGGKGGMCDKYQAVLSLGLTEAGKFCQYNQSSANETLPFFPKEDADGEVTIAQFK